MNIKIKERYNEIKNDKRIWIILISGLVIGIITHGMGIFNKYSFHDDSISFNDIGASYVSGRWGLGILYSLIMKYNGSRHISMATFNGFETILFVLLTVIILVYVLDIKSTKSIILLTGMFVSFPTITGIFGYMFVAPYQYLGALVGILGASIFHKYKNILSFIICTLLMAFGTSLYQANIPVYIACLLLFMVKDVYDSDYSFKEFFVYGFKQVAICITFMVEYFGINKLCLKLNNLELTTYKGINNWGKTSIKGYLKRVIEAYRQFLIPTNDYSGGGSVYEYHARYIYILFVIVMILFTCFVLYRIYKDNKRKAYEQIIIYVLYPLASYFVYVMTGKDEVHGLMMFGFSMVYPLAFFILETHNFQVYLKHIVYVLVGLLVIFNIRFANICYTKADMVQSQGISYFNTLISKIENIEGYDPNLPVVYINEYSKDESVLFSTNNRFDEIFMPPYTINTFINNYVWSYTMAYWNGYSPKLGDSSEFIDNKEVKEMPCYPSDGSIKIINENIIVKFAD